MLEMPGSDVLERVRRDGMGREGACAQAGSRWWGSGQHGQGSAGWGSVHTWWQDQDIVGKAAQGRRWWWGLRWQGSRWLEAAGLNMACMLDSGLEAVQVRQ